MTLKKGVIHDGVVAPIWVALGMAEMVYRFQGLQLVVTSLRDGKHGEGSLHPSGKAADLRIRDIPEDMIRPVHGSLVSSLNPLGFDVVLEADHIHIEYQPKGQKSWWRYE